MKKHIFLILIIIASTNLAHSYEWKSMNLSEPKIVPQYLLVIRYWGTISERGEDGFSMYSTQGWIYMNETYNSLDEVIDRLQTYTGRGMSAKEKEYALIGLWKLGDHNDISDKVLHVEETIHKKEVEIETQKWSEINWRKK